jgi:ubiquitin-protein ligase E3 C
VTLYCFYLTEVTSDHSPSEYNSASPAQDEDDASLLASYALMLLRIFPRLGEEIRMWLYQGSVAVNNSGTRIPALKFFWRAMSTTSTFSAVSNDSKSALAILRPRPHRHPSMVLPQEDIIRERDWRAILLFLELYAKVH